MILLWGVPEDPPMEVVRAALVTQGHPFLFVDQHDYARTQVELVVGEKVGGWLQTHEGSLLLEHVTAIYVRLHDAREFIEVHDLSMEDPLRQHLVSLESTLLSWLELTSARVVNRPSLMCGNNSKPYQSEMIRRHGFAVPDTLITTDRDALLEFWNAHGEVVYKSISGVRSIVSRLGDRHRERLDDLAWCPTQFQQRVRGTDYRVHVVGTETFACEIISDADDYRYAGQQGEAVSIQPCELPEACERRCRSLAYDLGLHVAGIDLRRTAEGTWYCFEVNPSPGFSYFQGITGQPIGDAIARLLASG